MPYIFRRLRFVHCTIWLWHRSLNWLRRIHPASSECSNFRINTVVSSHIYLFPPSFMHAATATRPLALITSQPTTNDYTVVSIGVRFSLSLFFGCSSHLLLDLGGDDRFF